MTKYYSEEHSVIKSLADISDIPPISSGIAGRALKINNLGTGYEWADAIVPDGRQQTICTISSGISWGLLIDGTSFSINPNASMSPDMLFDLDPISMTGVTNQGTVLSRESRYFDGSNDHITLNSKSVAVYGSSDRAFYIRFRATTLPINDSIGYLFSYGTAASYKSFSLAVNRDHFRFAGYSLDFIIPYYMENGVWYDVIIQLKSGTLELYVNDVLVHSSDTSILNTVEYELITLGAWADTLTSLFNGHIRHFRSFNRSLTLLEITSLSNATTNFYSIASELSSMINAGDGYSAEAVGNRVYIKAGSQYSVAAENIEIEMLPREFSLESLTEVPEPIPGQFLRRRLDNTAYEWIDAIIPDGRQQSIVTLNKIYTGVWEFTLPNLTISERVRPIDDSSIYIELIADHSYYDMTGQGRTATNTGVSIISDGILPKFETCYSFDTDKLLLPAINLASSSWSTVFWYKHVSSGSARQYIFTSQEYPPTSQTYTYMTGSTVMIDGANPDKLHVRCTPTFAILSDTVLTEGTWYHIAVVCELGQLPKIFINAIDHTGTNTTVYTATDTTNQNVTQIGTRSDANGTDYLKGRLNYFRLYTRALSNSEVTALYNENFTSPEDRISASINATSEYIAEGHDSKIYIKSVNSTTYSYTDLNNVTIEMLPREFSLESLTEVPEPVASQYLRRNYNDTAYEWAEAAGKFIDLADTPDIYSSGSYLRMTASGIQSVDGIILTADDSSEWVLKVTTSGVLYTEAYNG